MSKIIFNSLTGSLPYNVYVSDERGENETFLGTISSAIPPTQNFTPPNIFNGCENIMVIIENINMYRIFKLINCKHNCEFTIDLTQIID